MLLGGQGISQRLLDEGLPYVASVEDAVAEVTRLTASVAGRADGVRGQPAASPPS